MPNIKELSQLIADDLTANSGSFSLSFIAEQTERPLTDIEQLDGDDVRIYSVPGTRFNTIETRGSGMDDYLIELGVMARENDDRTRDELFAFADELWEYFKNKDIGSDYHWFSIEQPFLYDYKSLDKNYTFKTVFVLAYKVLIPWQ